MSKNPNALNVIAAGLGLATVLAAYAHGLNFGPPTGIAYAIVAAITLLMAYAAFAAEYSMQWVGQSLAVAVLVVVFWCLSYPAGDGPIPSYGPGGPFADVTKMNSADFRAAAFDARQVFKEDRRFKHLHLKFDDDDQAVYLSGKVILTTDLYDACDQLSQLGLKKIKWDVFVYQTNDYTSGSQDWVVPHY